jgi:hypothetical protein
MLGRMKAFTCFRIPDWALNGPYWFVRVSKDGGDPEPVEPMRMYATEAECQAERNRLEAEESRKTSKKTSNR